MNGNLSAPQSHAPILNARRIAPKLIGSDVELGNFVLGLRRESGTGALASRLLLQEIPGVPLPNQRISFPWAGQLQASDEPGNPQDWGRKYLPANGGCVYIDLDHVECCTPEILSAHDFAAAFHAMLRIARTALLAANARLPDGIKVVAVVNNEDGQGHAYGSHLSLLMTRTGWDRIFHRRLHQLLMLASFQVSSIILTGQGKVCSGLRNGDGHFELSQRASFFECLVGPQTTFNRPLVNSRDEALCGHSFDRCGPAHDYARLHSIFFDSTLCPGSIVLRTGLMQIMLSLLEASEAAADLDLILEDPVETVARWSRDSSLTTRARLLTGEETTALDLQRRFFDKAARFVAVGGCDGVVPAAWDILGLWADTLDKLGCQDLAGLAPRLDWVLKLQILEQAMQQHRGLNWSSPPIKLLDFKYADLEDGLFWACERAGGVESAGVSDAQIRNFTREPPEATRAWTRAQLLRRAEASSVADVDWDKITFKLRAQNGAEFRRTVSLPNPLGSTRSDLEPAFSSEVLGDVLDRLGATRRDPDPVYLASENGSAGSGGILISNSLNPLPDWRAGVDSGGTSHHTP